ncbi:MAG: YgaP family membrane protein [Burkholderiales bacterium]|nr:DUF2892 domain-containing protein [Sulfuricellaceae bacterium]
MKHNVGGVDKVLRIVVGLVLIGIAVAGIVPWWVGVIGLVPLGTALMGWCPLYPLLGLNTCPTKKE